MPPVCGFIQSNGLILGLSWLAALIWHKGARDRRRNPALRVSDAEGYTTDGILSLLGLPFGHVLD